MPGFVELLFQEWTLDCFKAAVDFTQHAQSDCPAVVFQVDQLSSCSIIFTLAVLLCQFRANLAALRFTTSSTNVWSKKEN